MMSLNPSFKLGWCNGWLGAIPLMLTMLILFISQKKATKRAMDMSAYTVREKIRTVASTYIFFGAVLYSIGLPLQWGTVWFYIGLIVYVCGCIPYIISTINFASTPLNEPIVKGVYTISRNPMYFFSALILLGTGIAGASWLMIVLVILFFVVNHSTVLAEERFCSDKYGESYRTYMKKVPRYFLFF
jgi:protein-S-isoprenylcysteine O-methyltransferase Ste14